MGRNLLFCTVIACGLSGSPLCATSMTRPSAPYPRSGRPHQAPQRTQSSYVSQGGRSIPPCKVPPPISRLSCPSSANVQFRGFLPRTRINLGTCPKNLDLTRVFRFRDSRFPWAGLLPGQCRSCSWFRPLHSSRRCEPATFCGVYHG